MIVTNKAASALGNNFDIATIDENGKEEIYTVKGSTTSGLTTYNPATNATTTAALLVANVSVGGFYEYTLDSNGNISSLKSFTTLLLQSLPVTPDTTTQAILVVSSAGTYLVNDATMVYVKQGASYKDMSAHSLR